MMRTITSGTTVVNLPVGESPGISWTEQRSASASAQLSAQTDDEEEKEEKVRADKAHLKDGDEEEVDVGQAYVVVQW